jgi:hypothetical protein
MSKFRLIMPAILDQISLFQVKYCPLDTTANGFFDIPAPIYSETLAGYCPLDTTANGFLNIPAPVYSETLAGYCPLDITTLF